MPENKRLTPPLPIPVVQSLSLGVGTVRTAAMADLAPSSEYPIDRPKQIRPGVRYRDADFPGHGKFSVPSPADRSAGAGTIHDYESMGKLQTPKLAKNLKGGR